jgi:predicted enzyme related to lactoylglutathione lyase
MPNPVVYFEVIGKDHKALVSFFGGVFGWETSPAGQGNYEFVSTGEAVSGGIGSPPEGGPSYATFYVQVDDLQATLDKAKSLGGRTVMEPMNVAENTDVALFEDPEGHIIGLVKMATSG